MATMRSVLNLNINLGLFGFPVKVYKATNDPAEGIGFRQLHADCGTPINQVKRCSKCEKDVAASELLKGYEIAGGKFVTFTEEEIKALKPEAAGTIKIEGYLAADEIDHTYQDGTVYFLKPDGKDFTTFTTWREALAGRWAVGKVVMYGREHVVAIRAVDRLLSMHFLRAHSEIRNIADVPGYETVPETANAEHLELMSQLVDQRTISFDDVVIDKDAYVLAVQALIESRIAGLPAPEQVEFKAAVTPGANLLEMLKASLAAAPAAK
jgi:DNA end-binding protein Ku